MRSDKVLKTTAIDAGDDARSRAVVEMTEPARNAPFEHRWIRPIHEQIEIVIALEHQRIDSRQHVLDVRSRVTGIGEQAEAAIAIAEDELRRFARVMRYWKRMNLELADHER